MNSLLHTVNITTLAGWLSVAGFGTVGVLLPSRIPVPDVSPAPAETQLLPEDFTLGGESSPESTEPPSETTPAGAVADNLPAPPEMPDLTALEPLPEIPIPPPAPAPAAIRKTPPAPRSSPRADTTAHVPRQTAGRSASSSSSSPAGKPGGGSGMSNAARLAAGRMPSPHYPPISRRNGQTGTVVVEFTVDVGGRVISAHAKSPSPWPLLNAEAVNTVRTWRFPPGGAMTLQRPIVFQLR